MKITKFNYMEDVILIAEQFNIEEVINVCNYGHGRINETFLVETESSPGNSSNPRRYILQKLHKILTPDVLKDIEVITNFLETKGFITPKLVSTKKGELGVLSGREIWRMLTFIPGTTVDKALNGDMVEDAASLFGKFHSALIDLNYEFLHKIPNFHNTKAIMDKLTSVSLRYKGTYKYNSLIPLTERVLMEYRGVDKSFQRLPDRIIHGDPKMNNVRFDDNGSKAVSLLDLDTLGRNKIIIDIGDAVRSWCSSSDDGGEFDLIIFERMMTGYMDNAFFMTKKERESIPNGVLLLILELTARYITDAFIESYFNLDAERYSNLFEQNKDKAIFQMRLFDDFQGKRETVSQVIMRFS